MLSPLSPRGAQPPRRGGISSPLTPHAKPIISVEEWEAKAPLGDLELRSVSSVKAAGERVPLPLKFSTEDGAAGPSRPSTPVLRNKIGGSRPSTPSLRPSTPRASTHPLHPAQPVRTPQQFYDWFALIDRSVAHSQEAHFRAHGARVVGHLDMCDALVERIDEVEAKVGGMLEEWRSVEEGGRSLKDACERVLEERDRLLRLTEALSERLAYFQELEHATRMLNHPGESLVLQTDFLYMVERVDICIEYLKAHRQFKEAEVYLLRFQQCLTRAMTLIRMYFVGSLRALSADVGRRLGEKDVSTTAQNHLLYTRFTSVTTSLAPLLGELERRAAAHPDELAALLSECHAAFFAARKGLLVGRIQEEIRGLDPGRTEIVELTRAGCSYLKQLCTDEFILYRAFFHSGDDQLYAYLENLCDYLYDDLRPRILHEPRLSALCEVCTVLQALMVLDVAPPSPTTPSTAATDRSEDEDKEPERLHISRLLQMVLQDAQTRLFFKAQSVVQAEVRYFQPKSEDLAYPDKLVEARKPATGLEIKEKESIRGQAFQLPSLDKQDTWYPTLRKTVWVLSQLHDFVKPAIFEDIAQESVGLCRQSLVTASEAIKTRNPPTSVLDGQLFLVRHLLILKEMTSNLDLVQRDVQPSIDFAGVTETLALMLNRTTSLLPGGLFASLGMPRGTESIADAKHNVDHELKRACEDVIASCADPPCKPLRAWVDRVRAYTSTSAAAPGPSAPPLTSQPWADQAAAEALDTNFRLSCERDLRSSVARLRLYLEDDRTVSVLVTHIQDGIVDEYGAFRELVWGMYAGALRASVLGSADLRELLKGICGVDEASGDGHGAS